MKRVYVIVEGQTEREFVSRVLAPYFGQAGILISAISMKHSGGGMGFSNLDYFKNNVEPLLYDKDAPVITTLVDLYRFPVQSSDYTEEASLKKWNAEPNADARLAGFQEVLVSVVRKIKPYPGFVPYIQKYELEALLFSDSTAFEYEEEKIKEKIQAIIEDFPNPEDINTTEMGHPAKRLETIFAASKKKYEKGADAVDFAELIGLETILKKCPRFRSWVETLMAKAQS
ncbi:MAG: DUF4276 family protein [Saprospiraceae bacterium]